MRFLDIVFHLTNFIAPALWMAIGMLLCERIFLRRRPIQMGWRQRGLMYAALGCAVLVGGLVLLGRDGKMFTYGAMVATIAMLSLTLQKAWKK